LQVAIELVFDFEQLLNRIDQITSFISIKKKGLPQ